MKLSEDPEYHRLVARYREAKAAGNLDLAHSYWKRAIQRGDELIVQLGGKAVFGPIADAVDKLIAS